jgi:hypothetical protein
MIPGPPPRLSPPPLALGPKALRAEAFGDGRREEVRRGFCGGRLRRPPQNLFRFLISLLPWPQNQGSDDFGTHLPEDCLCPLHVDEV